MKKILCIGDACADILLPYGSVKNGVGAVAAFSPGGTVANTASGLGRLGCECAFLGKAGKDYYGTRLLASLRKNGVDTKRFTLSEELSTVMVLVVLDASGDRFPFCMPPVNPSHLELYPADLGAELTEEFALVHTSGLMLFDNPAAKSICGFLEQCKKKNLPVSLDLNFRVETLGKSDAYLRRAMSCATVLLGSGRDELCPLTGFAEPAAAAKSLVTDRTAVVSRLGAEGAVVYTRDGESACKGFPVKVTDTLGAGDCYNSGYLYALSRGMEPDKANICGCAAAALSLTKPGAGNCPTRQELTDFLSAHGIAL